MILEISKYYVHKEIFGTYYFKVDSINGNFAYSNISDTFLIYSGGLQVLKDCSNYIIGDYHEIHKDEYMNFLPDSDLSKQIYFRKRKIEKLLELC